MGGVEYASRPGVLRLIITDPKVLNDGDSLDVEFSNVNEYGQAVQKNVKRFFESGLYSQLKELMGSNSRIDWPDVLAKAEDKIFPALIYDGKNLIFAEEEAKTAFEIKQETLDFCIKLSNNIVDLFYAKRPVSDFEFLIMCKEAKDLKEISLGNALKMYYAVDNPASFAKEQKESAVNYINIYTTKTKDFSKKVASFDESVKPSFQEFQKDSGFIVNELEKIIVKLSSKLSSIDADKSFSFLKFEMQSYPYLIDKAVKVYQESFNISESGQESFVDSIDDSIKILTDKNIMLLKSNKLPLEFRQELFKSHPEMPAKLVELYNEVNGSLTDLVFK